MSNMELMWMITSKISMVITLLCTGICLGVLVRPYLRRGKSAISVSAVYFVVMTVLYLIPPHIDNFMAYGIGMLAAFLVMYFEDRRNVEQKIFLSITFFSLRWLSMAMVGNMFFLLVDKGIMEQVTTDNMKLQYGMYVVSNALQIIVGFVFMLYVVSLLNKTFIYKRANMKKKELLMLLMPSLSAMIGYGILQFYQSLYEKDTGNSLWSIYGVYGVLCLISYAVFIISILVMTIMFQNLKARQEEDYRQELLQRQITDMKNHIAEVEKLNNDMRAFRHDFGNQIQTTLHLIEHGEMGQAYQFASELKKSYQSIIPEIKTGNPITDVILLEKKKEVEAKNIRFDSDFHFPDNSGINAFDLSIILNNALDNSLEAANGDSPYIKVSSYKQNHMFMIVIENSFEGKITIDLDSQLPISTKQGDLHGFGLHNIRLVARKYLGDMDFEQEEKKAVITVMLQME